MWAAYFLLATIPLAWGATEVYDWILRGSDSYEDVPS